MSDTPNHLDRIAELAEAEAAHKAEKRHAGWPELPEALPWDMKEQANGKPKEVPPTPLKVIRHVLRTAHDRILLIDGLKGGLGTAVLNGNGLWEMPTGTQHHRWMYEAARQAGSSAHPQPIRDALAMVQSVAKPVGGAPWPRTVHAAELDADMRWMAAPNGIIDLVEGRLVEKGHRGACLVTDRRLVPDDFDPDADSVPEAAEMIERLFRHIDPSRRDWIIASFGFALHGDPAKRIHAFTGPTGGGKSTAAQAAVNCLGDYGAKGRPTSIHRRSGSGSSERFEDAGVWFSPVRIAVFDELDGIVLDAAKLKDFSSGGIGTREFKNKDLEHKARITATAFLACNDDQVRSMGAQQQAMSDRLFITRMEAIDPEQQSREVPNAFQHDPVVRQGLLALLVRAAAASRVPPVQPGFIETERQRRIRADRGIIGVWLHDEIVLEEGLGTLAQAEVHEAMLSDPDQAVRREAEKLSPEQLSNRLRQYVDGWDSLPDGRNRKGRGKKNARLSTEAQERQKLRDGGAYEQPSRDQLPVPNWSRGETGERLPWSERD